MIFAQRAGSDQARTGQSVKDLDLVTVIIPARNEEQSIGACLDSVLAQDYPNLQVVVVDGSSTDRTADAVAARMADDQRVELLHNPRRNIPSSLNLAVSRARGRWLVRVDAHSTIGTDYVRRAVARLREGCWAGVGGRKDAVGSTAAGQAIALALASRLGVGNSRYHYGTTVTEVDHLPFGAYPVQVIRDAGGWDERLTANEDFELDHRLRSAGGRLLFDPAMVIRWQCRETIADLYRQYHRYGRGKVDVTWLHPRSLKARHVAPPAFVLYAAGSLAAGRRHPARALAMLAPYLLAVTLESLRVGRRLERSSARAFLPAAFVAMHVGWGVGFWTGVGTRLVARPPEMGDCHDTSRTPSVSSSRAPGTLEIGL
jgi:succinoglycan biosynthesis protein ExoA